MKTIKIILIIAGFFLLGYSLTSCQQQTAQQNADDHHDHGDAGHEDESLHLNKKQIAATGIEFGDFADVKINDFIKVTGTLGLPPNAFASVHTKANGIISGNKKYVEGNYINKGKVIAYLENPEFIVDQQMYLEAKANLKLKKLDLERQKALSDADAGIVKQLQNAQAQVEILEAKTSGLQKRLSYLGINTENLTAQNISQQVAIYAPMSGYISSINLHKGMYAQSTIPLMEIIADDHIHLELDVFEKDIAYIKVGQKISYTVPAFGAKNYAGEISVIGKEFNHEAKTVRIHGHLEGEKPTFIKDLFINAKIWLNDATTQALPDEAIIKDGASTYIYAANYDPNANETFFEKITVVSGSSDNGYTAVKLLSDVPNGMQIVVKGAYFVYSQSVVGEIEHNH